MCDGLHTGPSGQQQFTCGAVEDHGVAPRNALDQRIAKARWVLEQVGVADSLVVLIHQHGARAVQRRLVCRHRLQPLHGALELVGVPKVVLVAESEVLRLDLRLAGQGQEVGCGALARPWPQVQAIGSPLRLVLLQEVQRLVRGPVVRDPDLPGLPGLCLEGLELIGEKALCLMRAQQDGHMGLLRWPLRWGPRRCGWSNRVLAVMLLALARPRGGTACAGQGSGVMQVWRHELES